MVDASPRAGIVPKKSQVERAKREGWIHVPAMHLIGLVKSLNSAHVADWKARYDSDLMGDSHWTLRLKIQGQWYSSAGYNAYPDEFEAMRRALRILVSEE